jgi:hypothetical protein
MIWYDMLWQHVKYIISLYWLWNCFFPLPPIYFLFARTFASRSPCATLPCGRRDRPLTWGDLKNIRWWMDQVDGCWWLRHVETCNIFPRKINLTERVDETPKPEEWRFEFYFDVRHGLGIRIYQPRAHQKSFCEKKGNSIFFRSFLCFKQMTGMQVEAVV